MRKLFYLLALVILGSNTFATDLTVCKGTFALCTTAKCIPVAGKTGEVSCQCDVKKGYSAAAKGCELVKNTNEGKLIYSRYYPIKGYVACSNARPWAWCLDKPCIIDKKHPTKANCTCSVVSNQGDYVIVTNKYTETTCTTDLYSSATVEEVKQMDDFLKNQPKLKPYPIKVHTAH